jgi:hypothetical protein
MQSNKNSGSILLSIFLRKGGEGTLTKIITDENKIEYLNQLRLLEENENALLCFKENERNWLVFTNKRIFGEQGDVKLSIPFSNLESVNLAMADEFNDKVYNKTDFTRLLLKEKNGNQYLVKIEKGRPFQGVYQMLYYLA